MQRSQERALAALICTSPESVEAFIGFCIAEAAALLRPREHIVRALTDELLARRTMTGGEVDAVIAAAVAAKAAEDERQRRLDWRSRETSAARLVADVSLNVRSSAPKISNTCKSGRVPDRQFRHLDR